MSGHLNQRYQLGEVVGSGGMGSVHRATDLRLERTVAIKLLRGEPEVDDVARARMRSEAQLAASIHHPGVAQVFDFDEDRGSADGSTFIVMEFVEGHSLAELLRERGPLPADEVMSVVQQVADGLAATHARGIVHRDLKPANIMLTPEGRTVLVDFGIAQTASSEPLTDTGALVGTTDYLSPEQVRGRSATAQSDLYALGVVAYHCLTGTSPFRRETHIATAMAQLHDDLPPLGDDVPSRLAALLRVMTAKDPADRPAGAAEVATEAAAIGAAQTIDVPPTFELARPVVPGPAPTTASPTSDGLTPAEPRRRRTSVVFASVGVLVALAAVLGGRELLSGEAPVVPDVVGATVEEAESELRDADLVTRTRLVDVAGRPAGQVVKQSPAAGTTAAENDPVQLLVASGKVRVAASDIIGQPYAKAASSLEKKGFVVRREDVTQASDAGEVVALDRSGRLASGVAITLSVAVAPTTTATTGGTSTGTGSGAAPKKSPGNGPGSDNGKAKGKNKGKGKGKGN
ncbi:protein kinase domain-containing protein [Aeromicrobium sp.]|uniref:protein kinase domain-containing protein n=1 Tax=Aeromicrobium sp. TaxID=1871063 RepID=UPI0028AE43B5|nr:protein kinase [Aeromicrobium sp.]